MRAPSPCQAGPHKPLMHLTRSLASFSLDLAAFTAPVTGHGADVADHPDSGGATMAKRRATPVSHVLTAKQTRQLLASSPAPDPEVAGRVLADAYRLDQDQSLLVFENGRGRLYESRAAMLTMMDAIADEPCRSSAADRLPEGREFPTHAKRLAIELGITALAELDEVVHRLGVEVCLDPPMFGRLVAYFGEAIIRARSGDWQMRLATDGRTWEPWVVDADGRAHAPFGLIFKELIEWGPESSLTGLLVGHLAASGPRPLIYPRR